MIGAAEFVSKIEAIAARELTYRTGGVGKDGTCDCIGLVMGAMYELGYKKYDMHSTNYFARYQTLEMKMASKEELFVGQLLFRTRKSTAKLNKRYQPGGRYYTGDMLDYYHVAVVTSTKPLRIIECTEYGSVNGIVINTSFKNWQHGGKLKDVLYDGEEVGEGREEPLYKAIVNTRSGALNIREWAEDGPVIGKAPKGTVVDVLDEAGEGWLKVCHNGMIGYANGMYLARTMPEEGNDPNHPAEGEETMETAITIIDSAGNRFNPVGDWRVLIGSID